MKKLMTKIAAILTVLILTSLNLFAQTNDVEMADALRSSGKIYIVVICILIILLGLLAYLFIIDKRLKMLEKKIVNKN
ncbi:MAG: CcmD family protein [Pedobacter sp.]|nr:MAG: CcmD family protein [Pedobacter sp.]